MKTYIFSPLTAVISCTTVRAAVSAARKRWRFSAKTMTYPYTAYRLFERVSVGVAKNLCCAAAFHCVAAYGLNLRQHHPLVVMEQR